MFYHDYYNVDPFKPVNVEFNMFTLEEVKKLSVARIDSLISFTPLGEPVQGGLYDIRLGPSFMGGGKCMTCNQNNQSCPGHFGHIDLPCPVVNPLYSTVVIHILKLCCLSCYKVLLPRQNTLLLAAQLKLVDNGQLVDAYNLQNEINGLNDEDDERHLSTDEIEGVIDLYLKRYIQEDEIAYMKNADEIRQTFIAETLHQVTRRKGCLYCKAPLSTVSKSFSKITISHGTKSKKVKGYLFPQEIKNLLRQIWINEKHFIAALLPVLARIDSEYPTDACFMTEILVTPSNLRPNLMVRGKIVESPRNATYKSIIREAKLIQYIHLLQDYAEGQEIPEDIIELVRDSQGQDNVEKVQIGMHNLQMCVDALLDGTAIKSLSSKESSVRIGLKQLLEKKSGIIRQNMMGKRVDYFARSVITPDPCLDIDQIGIPVEFAKKLTYPIAVTDWNIKGLHGIVLNGPNHYPGANLIESDVGTVKWLSASNKSRREALSKTLFCQGPNSRGPQIVHRHVVDGDMMLVNRQPSLHKPSIMAHRVKVLKGEKTLRLHYANCKAYNADFDGDEMNVHLPQSELAKCEAQELASVVNQYLVPRDGTPLSGLIQDHIISSVRMTIRGRFFTRREYMYFVYQALSSLDQDIKTLPPAILKPVMLWSGKQIISTLIINLTPVNRKTSINLFSKTKLEQKFWKNPNNFEYPNLLSEFNVIIRDGNLVSGILDKNHIGASTYSLIHCFYELYGGKYSSKLLSAFSKLFTVYLQFDAFTLGVEDILVTDKANYQREMAINESKNAGILAALESLGIESLPEDVLMKKLGESYSKIAHFSSLVDRNYKKHLQPYTNKITKSCVPKGLLQPFPENNLQLMVQSGAKGSTVNTIQISCCLGQIELEGKRPPLMISGRSLPSFPPFDTLPKAGGFIGSRFMTGIQPQEFFFHCMAGREGLIDTAVKTSRSGYLQRCLVKHLESLIVNYDMTVRDSNGSVIQYLYGEDGLEVTKSSFFNKKQFGFLVDNIDSFRALKQIRNDEYYKEIDDRLEEIKSAILKKNNEKKSIRESGFLSWCKENSIMKCEKNDKIKNGRYKRDTKLCKKWNELDDGVKKNYAISTGKIPDPVSATFHLGGHYGLISEKMDLSIDDYFNENENDQSKKLKRNAKESIRIKAMAATAAAGEPVGCIAAQSVGEPSTQMTLNTFHFAGRGEMNVTLGIPRLREILMMATKTIKTPSMEIPFIPSENIEEKSEALRKLMSKITLKDVLSKIQVQEKVKLRPIRHTCYDLILHILPHRCYESTTHVTPKTVMKFIKHQFPISLHKMFDKYLSNNFSGELISEEAKRVLKMNREHFDEDNALDDVELQESKSKTINNDDSDSESEAGEFDSTAMKRKAQTEEYDYEKDEDDPPSDGEIKANDSHSEFETSIKIENHFVDDENNVLAKEKNVQELKLVKNDFSGVTIDVYKTDRENLLWAKVRVTVPLEFKRLDLTSLLKDLVERVVIHEIPGINRAILTEVNSRTVLKTEGSRGVAELFRFQDLDLNALYCNDIQMMLNTYGVEAANRVIINEVKNVFKVYGINVDTRHLSLIADYMTYDGTYKPLNRLGMNGCPSPLQQMSFESTLNYLKKATARGLKDNLVSPSSSLIVGQQAKIGSGLVKLLWQ